MEKKETSPWKWQDELTYVQAVEVTNVSGTLYVSGQAAVLPDGTSSDAPMREQMQIAIANLEEVVTKAGYELKNIVRLTVYHTNEAEMFANFELLQNWLKKHGIKQATTVCQVVALYKTLKFELEATVVK
ncbi:MAG: RidA family protein [Flavitalea sp.]